MFRENFLPPFSGQKSKKCVERKRYGYREKWTTCPERERRTIGRSKGEEEELGENGLGRYEEE
jgi:hypothetical protein